MRSHILTMLFIASCSGGNGAGLEDLRVVNDTASEPCPAGPQEVVHVAPSGGLHSAAATVSSTVYVAHAHADSGAILLSTKTNEWATTSLLSGHARIEPSWFGRSIAVAVLPDGDVVVVFFDADTQSLKAAFLSGGNWSFDTVDPKEMVGQDVSIAVMAEGIIHVAYLDLGEMNLRHAWGKKGSWSTQVVDNSGLGGNDPSIAISPDGAVHITYYHCGDLGAMECSGHGRLRHAVLGVNEIEIEDVDLDGDAGWYSALTFDADVVPVVSYQAHGKGELRFARRDQTWHIQTLDKGPSAGAYSTMLRVGKTLYIAYEGADGKLRLARGDGSSWDFTSFDTLASYPALTLINDCTVLCAFRNGNGLAVVEFSP